MCWIKPIDSTCLPIVQSISGEGADEISLIDMAGFFRGIGESNSRLSMRSLVYSCRRRSFNYSLKVRHIKGHFKRGWLWLDTTSATYLSWIQLPADIRHLTISMS
ncbi:hypothetical protein LENED_001536 [Lentinula edodes]|uniref:Uncharacterized protein n=1 Tax=Lentinula edodes TaxID=5353 RepID=A0A1Q3DYW2_LENED|nr:hypothetical protein LENED_001536 [Lentinula edodes]